MNDLVKTFDNLPLIVKIILALPFIDGIAWGIYRIAKGRIIAGLVWILVGWSILWIIDMITIILHGKPTVFA